MLEQLPVPKVIIRIVMDYAKTVVVICSQGTITLFDGKEFADIYTSAKEFDLKLCGNVCIKVVKLLIYI